MKDEIKTFDDYKALVKEFKESDSVSRRWAIKDAIYNKARVVRHEIIALYAKYGKNYVYASEFQESCGELSLCEFDESTVVLHYEDHWAYGGECDIIITVQMKYLDSDEMEALEKELREEHAARVKELIQVKRHAFEQLEAEIEELETEVEELERNNHTTSWHKEMNNDTKGDDVS